MHRRGHPGRSCPRAHIVQHSRVRLHMLLCHIQDHGQESTRDAIPPAEPYRPQDKPVSKRTTRSRRDRVGGTPQKAMINKTVARASQQVNSHQLRPDRFELQHLCTHKSLPAQVDPAKQRESRDRLAVEHHLGQATRSWGLAALPFPCPTTQLGRRKMTSWTPRRDIVTTLVSSTRLPGGLCHIARRLSIPDPMDMIDP